MDKQSAINLIRETFENPFEKKRFVCFVQNLFNKISLEPFEYNGQYIPDTFKPYINKYERIGKYESEGKRIDVLIVYLNKETSIERARTMQRNFVAGYLTGKYGSDTEKDAALVAFVSPGLEDWRFSLVKMEYKLTQTKTGRPKGKEEFTPARRYSFLVGKNEPNHTAQQQLLPVLQDDIKNPTLDQLEKAFSVEKVAKEFLNKYRDLYLQLKNSIDKIVKKDKDVREEFKKRNINTIDFSKKLLGQIVFLYFLQKKGWLGVPSDKNWGEGDRNFLRSLFDKCIQENKNFFNDYLEILFYNTLNDPRLNQADPSYSKYFDCRIPFLNGGLFEPISNYDWKRTDIIISNELFSNKEKTEEGDIGAGILDVFDRFNFTVQEDEPLEKEVALDPELLGKVFENLIEENLRKGQGAYYTPREIVHYMCQESLINYLWTELEDKVTKADIELFIKHGEHLIENEKTALQKEEDIKSGKQKSTTIKSKMPESIKNYAKQIDDKLANIRVCDPAVGSGAFPVGMMLEIVKARNALTNYLPKKEERTLYNFKRHCIENCLYGVDIDSSAIDIAKLRFWLSLVVDEEDVTKIKPLPNLDYKLVCGNSLLGVERDLLNDHLFKELEKLKPLHLKETDMDKKQQYKRQIDKLIKQITNNDEHFDFEIYFSEVFHKKKGFDVVIGNPPYAVYDINEKLKDNYRKSFKAINYKYSGIKNQFNLAILFIEKSYELLKENGIFTMIVPHSISRVIGYHYIRDYLDKNADVFHIVDEYGQFEGVTLEMITIFYRKHTPPTDFIRCFSKRNQQSYNVPKQICRKEKYYILYFDKLYLKIKNKSEKILNGYRGYEVNSSDCSKEFKTMYLDGKNIQKYYISPFPHLRYVNKKHYGLQLSKFEIVITQFGTLPRGTIIDTDKMLPSGGTVVVTFDRKNFNPKYILSILNSNLIKYFFYRYIINCAELTIHLDGHYLNQIPILKISESDQKPFIELVDKILAITKDDDYLNNSSKQAKVKEYERQIDQMVYKLYGLTKDEIKIVEGASK
jgi:hypothetical protein